jgi:hypothetical protein
MPPAWRRILPIHLFADISEATNDRILLRLQREIESGTIAVGRTPFAAAPFVAKNRRPDAPLAPYRLSFSKKQRKFTSY